MKLANFFFVLLTRLRCGVVLHDGWFSRLEPDSRGVLSAAIGARRSHITTVDSVYHLQLLILRRFGR